MSENHRAPSGYAENTSSAVETHTCRTCGALVHVYFVEEHDEFHKSQAEIDRSVQTLAIMTGVSLR